MSVFFKNSCQFDNCRKNFYTLRDLIIHIENDHLDFDPYKMEQLEDEKPESIPLSYVLKFGTSEDSPPQYSDEVSYLNETVIEEPGEISTIEEVVNSFNYLGCDIKEEKVKYTRSNDLREEIPPTFLGNHKLFTLDNNQKKPFGCNMPGCEKRYKNVNGIKYHYKNHHKMYNVFDKNAKYNKPLFSSSQTPAVKKSLLRYKPPKPKLGRHELHGIPLLSFKPQNCPQMSKDIVIHNIQNMTRFEEIEAPPNDYFYKFNTLPTSTALHVSNQVPLPNMSFNYYNVSNLNGDNEGFSEKNSNFFVPNFDKP